MLALVFKFPVDKPPFFGIKFDSVFDAEQTNKFFPRHKDGWTANIKVEGVRVLITIKNISYQHDHTYTIYEWNKKEMIAFLQACKDHQTVTFGHVTKEGEDIKIAYWSQLGFAWWIRISKIQYSSG